MYYVVTLSSLGKYYVVILSSLEKEIQDGRLVFQSFREAIECVRRINATTGLRTEVRKDGRVYKALEAAEQECWKP